MVDVFKLSILAFIFSDDIFRDRIRHYRSAASLKVHGPLRRTHGQPFREKALVDAMLHSSTGVLLQSAV